MKHSGKTIIVILICSFIVLLFLSIYITVEEKIPGNAIVVVTLEDKLYHSIHFDVICVENNKTVKTKTLSEALAEGYKPHEYDIELGYFKGNRRFLFHHILSKLGFNVNSRWDKDGNWMW
jgi:hypothetical protein